MDIFIMQYKYRSKFLVVIIDTIVYVYKYEKCKFGPAILSFQAKKNIFIGKSKICSMTQFSGATDNSSVFDGNILLLESENNEYVYISGLEIFKFKTDDKIIDYISLMGNNMTHMLLWLEKNIHISYTIATNLLKTIKLRKVPY